MIWLIGSAQNTYLRLVSRQVPSFISAGRQPKALTY
jgi:hypothetical protein